MIPSFKNPHLFDHALTHSSYANEHSTDPLSDNERLEFLGDAVLDFIAAAWLFEKFPGFDEGRLTSIRAALVKVSTLAEFAKQIGLPDLLKLGKGELDTGGRNRANILGDAFEALLGALYVDQGIDAVSACVVPFFEQATPAIVGENLDRDAKSRLQEWSQGTLNVTPRYRLVSTEGPDHAKIFTVAVWLGETLAATGSGTSKQQAEQIAAREALLRASELEESPPVAPSSGGEAEQSESHELTAE